MPVIIFRTSSVVLLLIFALQLAGCSQSWQQLIHEQRNQGDYANVENRLLQLIENDPQNIAAHRELGITYYMMAIDYDALTYLEKAYEMSKNRGQLDGKTLYYLGSLYEKQNRYIEALHVLKRYNGLELNSYLENLLSAKLESVRRKVMEIEAKQALRNENQIDTQNMARNSVAVLYFENLSDNQNLDPLQKGITDMLIHDLSQVSSLTVIERVRLQELLDEMYIGSTPIVNEYTAPRVGKLLGAEIMVNGSVIDLAAAQLRIDAGLIDTRSGEINTRVTHEGGQMNFFELQKEVTFGLLDKMNIRLSDEERRAIQKIPTESYMAFILYCRGLDFEDRGYLDQAEEMYQEAVSLDPNFERAEMKLQQSKMIMDLQKNTASVEAGIDDTEEEGGAAQEGQDLSVSLRDRLLDTTQQLTGEVIEGIDDRDPYEPSSFGRTIKVRIEVEVPDNN